MLLVRQRRRGPQLLVLERRDSKNVAGLQLGIVGGVESCNCSSMSDDQISDRSNPPPSACSMSSGTVQTGAVKPRWRCLRQIGPVYLVVVHILSYASFSHLRMTITTQCHSRLGRCRVRTASCFLYHRQSSRIRSWDPHQRSPGSIVVLQKVIHISESC